MYKTPSGIYQSAVFDEIGIVHGFSTKLFGDMQRKDEREKFLQVLGIDTSSLVQEKQVHGDRIHTVTLDDRGKTIQGVDGLVYKKRSDTAPVILSVHTADCVPLLFFDPVERIIGSAHAGWKGTVLHIGKKVIDAMQTLGAQAKNIRVIIGPRICGNCYTAFQERADIVTKEFPDESIVQQHNGMWYVDIGKANYADLLDLGIDSKHIDYDPLLCTYEKHDEWYSFRQEGKKLRGEMMGVVGFLSDNLL